VPEKLHLLYPKCLAGRLEISNDLRANVEVADPRAIRNESRLIDIDQVRELSTLILRLEALSAASPPQLPSSPVLSPTSPTSPRTPSTRSQTVPITQSSHPVTVPPAFLGPAIREEMTDEELTMIIESLTTRAENSMSTLVRFSIIM
jgi:adenylate cyclase